MQECWLIIFFEIVWFNIDVVGREKPLFTQYKVRMKT